MPNDPTGRIARGFGFVLVCVILILSAFMLVGCATTPHDRLEPLVVTKEVKVEVAVPCKALEQLGPEPVYPDTDQAIEAAHGIGQLAALYAKGRIVRIQRLAEYATAKAACIF